MNINAQPLRLHDARSNKSGFLAATLGAFTFAAATCSGVTPTQDKTGSIWPTSGWQTSTPEEQGMDSKELAKLVDFGAEHFLSSTGATPSSQLDSLLIIRHGKIVAEAYYAPYAAGILHQVNSVTKAITSTLIGIACKEGLLDTPNHKVLDFFDRHDIGNLDDKKEAITIQNLLDMTSGTGWSSLDWKVLQVRQYPNSFGPPIGSNSFWTGRCGPLRVSTSITIAAIRICSRRSSPRSQE